MKNKPSLTLCILLKFDIIVFRELKDDGPKDGLCKPKYRAATLITLLKAADLEKMEKGGTYKRTY